VTNDRVGPNENFNIHSFRNQSLANGVYLWSKATARAPSAGLQAQAVPDRPERVVHPAVRVVIVVVVLLLLAVTLALARLENRLAQATAYSLACCATLLVSPLAWGHYYMVEAPALLCVPLWLLRRGMPNLARAMAVIPPLLSWSYYVAMPYTGALGLLGLGTTAWFLIASGSIIALEVAQRNVRSPLLSSGTLEIARL
jgi:hypothetical protein